MNELPKLILAREHIQHGLTPKELASRCRSGALVRVRRGVYVDGGVWRALKPWEQYRVRVGAAAESFVAPTVFARHSAAAVWRIPTIGLRHPVHALTLQNDGGRSRAGVLRHYAPQAGLKCVRRDGLLVTGRVRTVLDLAAFSPFVEAVVPVDHVLKPDVAQGLLGSHEGAALGRSRGKLHRGCREADPGGSGVCRSAVRVSRRVIQQGPHVGGRV
ncbi:hypothetical protein ACOM2C_09075 [Pseudarthrobacter sp. So.54]